MTKTEKEVLEAALELGRYWEEHKCVDPPNDFWKGCPPGKLYVLLVKLRTERGTE